MSDGTFSNVGGAVSALDMLHSAEQSDDINKRFEAAANILLSRSLSKEKKVSSGGVELVPGEGFDLSSLNNITSFLSFFNATNVLSDRTLAIFAIKLLLGFQGGTIPPFAITDIQIPSPEGMSLQDRFIASTNLLIPFSDTSPYGAVFYDLLGSWDDWDGHELSPTTKQLGEDLSEIAFISGIFGSLIRARNSSSPNRKQAILTLIYGRHQSDIVSDLDQMSAFNQLVWLIEFLYSIGFREANFLKLRTLVLSSESISSLGFLTKLSDFLQSMWPGLPTDLGLP